MDGLKRVAEYQLLKIYMHKLDLTATLFSLFSCRFLVWFLNQHMPTEEEANAAINALNGTMLHGYKMNVEVSNGQCANCRVD